MANLSYGSRGDDVKRLQRALGINADGIFGTQTQQAVRNYQSKNGLTVDGIAGTQTLGKLYGGGSGSQAVQAAQATQETTDPNQQAQAPTQTISLTAKTSRGTTYNPLEQTGTQADLSALEAAAPTYQQTQALTDALNALQGRMAAKPAEYVSPYQDQLAALYEQATKARDPFSYDPNADPLYQMYKDRYTAGAQQSMRDTMAEAAALTGGYGNSYAQAAGQQAYDERMNGLNEALPQLYAQKYQEWLDQGNDTLQRLQVMRDADQTAYGRYADQLADYYNQLNAERTLANDMYDREYGQYADQLGNWQKDRGYYYQKAADELAQQNYENELMMQMEAAAAKGGGGGGGGSKKSGGSGSAQSSSYKTVSKTASGMKPQDAYAYIGRMVDGGYITPEEGERILGVEMGVDLGQFAGNTSPEQLAAAGANKIMNTLGGLYDRLSNLGGNNTTAKDLGIDAVSQAAPSVSGQYKKPATTSTTKKTEENEEEKKKKNNGVNKSILDNFWRLVNN